MMKLITSIIVFSVALATKLGRPNHKPPSFLERIKSALGREDVNLSENMLASARYPPAGAIPYIKNDLQLVQFLEHFPAIEKVHYDAVGKTNGLTVLLGCCMNGAYNAALTLIIHVDVNVNVQAPDGRTPLMIVAPLIGLVPKYKQLMDALLERSNFDIADTMFRHIFDVYQLTIPQFNTALIGALERGHTRTVSMILCYNERNIFDIVPYIKSYQMASAVFSANELLAISGANNYHPTKGTFILHNAIDSMDLHFLRFVLEKYKPMMNPINPFSVPFDSPLIYALKNLARSGTLILRQMVHELVVYAGWDLNDLADIEPVRDVMESAEHQLESSTLTLMHQFLDRKAYLVAKIKESLARHPTTKRQLEELGLDTSFPEGYEGAKMRATLVSALSANANNVVDFLLRFGTNARGLLSHFTSYKQLEKLKHYQGDEEYLRVIRFVFNDNNASLPYFHQVCWDGDLAAARKCLVDLEIDPNIVDDHGRTCLMITLKALAEGKSGEAYKEIVKLLIPYSDMEIQDKAGSSAITLSGLRSVYKKLRFEDVGSIVDRRARHPLSVTSERRYSWAPQEKEVS